MPAQQPAALKLLNGRGHGRDAGGRPVNTGPQFTRRAPEPPEWLDDVAREEWFRVVPGLTSLDLLKEEDRAMLTAYCSTWSRYVAASIDVQNNGMTVTNHSTRKDGTESEWVTTNPSVGIAKNAGAELRSFASQFGLSPASEQNLAKGGNGADADANPF